LYLVDTNVISAIAPPRTSISVPLADWLERHTDRLYLSVITVAEIETGISKSRREGARRKAQDLEDWLDAVLNLYGNRILPLDIETAKWVGALSDLARSRGRPPGLADIIVAASARRNRFTILTRNLRHFAALDVPALDPFEGLPRP
jgi:toxin FitB